MSRTLPAFALSCAFLWAAAATAADDIKVIKLEQDVRNLERQVQTLMRQVDELRMQLSRSGDRPLVSPSSPAPSAGTGAWLDASKWQRLKPGMSELEVITALGPPVSMRDENGTRVLLYAMEIGSSGFLGGSVSLRDRAVVEVRPPTLR